MTSWMKSILASLRKNNPPIKTNEHVENILLTTQEILNSFGFTVFLGGSRRFGYNRDDSDYDLFASIENFKQFSMIEVGDKGWMELRKTFELMKFSYRGFNDYSETPGIQFVSDIQPHIQLTIIKDWDEFSKERDSHLRVQLLLEDKPELLHFIKTMRLHGSEVYRTIRDMEIPK